MEFEYLAIVVGLLLAARGVMWVPAGNVFVVGPRGSKREGCRGKEAGLQFRNPFRVVLMRVPQKMCIRPEVTFLTADRQYRNTVRFQVNMRVSAFEAVRIFCALHDPKVVALPQLVHQWLSSAVAEVMCQASKPGVHHAEGSRIISEFNNLARRNIEDRAVGAELLETLVEDAERLWSVSA